MWEALRREGIALEPPVPLHENVYLGCGQRAVEPDKEEIAKKREMLNRISMIINMESLILQGGIP